jgi:polyhydroxybutyrate depolymerase
LIGNKLHPLAIALQFAYLALLKFRRGIFHDKVRENAMTAPARAALARTIYPSLFTLLLALGSAAGASEVERTLVFQGEARSYLLHVPDSSATARPLVMVLHGGGGNARNAERMSGMSDIADRENFVVVYPNGSGRLRRALLTWNAGNCCGMALDEQVDDVGFLNAVLDDVARRTPIDSRRLYVTGMSNGGMMTYRLGCESAARFAAIAPVAGAMNVDCRPAAALSVIAFHGTADQHVLYDGGTPSKSIDRHPRVDTPVRQTITFWQQFDGCQAYATDTAAEVTTDDWGKCKAGTEVELNTLEGFGHAWPGGQKGSPRGDDPTASIDASEAMWQFFSRHSR